MRGIILFIVIIASVSAIGQEEWTGYQPTDSIVVAGDSIQYDTVRQIDFNKNGTVTINKDARIDHLTDLKRGNKTIMKTGFRVQIRLSQQKDEINVLRARFISSYENHRAHVDYNQPNFVLKVGDFYTRQQALEFKYEIAEIFPAAIVVKDNIELPKLESDL
ncbi:MAG: hypothetical protein ACI9J3_002489 [Parvicellaceae bacterium]|jgi:hypothetical protein